MERVVLSKPEFVLENGIRKIGQTDIKRTNVAEMIEAVTADSFNLVENAEGRKFLHILNSETEEYFSVKVGDKVDSKKKGKDLIADLLANYTIYCGATENGTWFTFGPVGATGEAIATLTSEELKRMKLKLYSGS